MWRDLTSLKSSKIYITLKMSLGRVFETIFPFLIFHKKNEDRTYYRQLSHILAFKSPKLLFHIQYKNLYTKSHTLFITKKTLVCCKVINSRYIKLQKLITFGIRLYLRSFQSCSNFSRFKKLNYGYWQQQDVN